MGITPSVNLEEYQNANVTNDYFVITMGWTDRLRLILAPDSIIQSTKEILSYTWQIQDTYSSSGFTEFKLKGTPWRSIGVDNINVKFFMCSLLKHYYSLGWHLETSSDLNRYGHDTDVLFFKRKEPLQTFVICLSLNSTDKIRVLAPENLIPPLRQAICKRWSKGIQDERQYDKSFEFKLKGNPWTDWAHDSREAFEIPCLITDLFQALYREGWNYTCAINSGKSDYSLNALYFHYVPVDIKNDGFFSLTLNKTDRIRLFDLPNELLKNLISIMNEFWPKGIQEQGLKSNCYEFKLKGNPWWSDAEEAVESRKLLSNLFQLFSVNGWKMYGSCDLTKSSSKKSTFFFKYSAPNAGSIHNFCLSLNESDKIRIINNNDMKLPDQIRSSIIQTWPKGIQKEKNYFNSWQFKLNGYPFECLAKTHVYTCILMMTILKTIESNGYRLLCSADVSGKYYHDSNNHTDHPVDLDSWFFEVEN